MADIFRQGKGQQSRLVEHPRAPSVPCTLCWPPLALCLNKFLQCSKTQSEATLIYTTSSVPSFGITFPLSPLAPHCTLSGCCCSLCIVATSDPSRVQACLPCWMVTKWRTKTWVPHTECFPLCPPALVTALSAG